MILSANQSAPSFKIDLAGMKEAFKYSPLILIAAASCFVKRNAVLGILTVALFIYVLSTRMYIYRVIYVLPYMMTLICSFGHSAFVTKSRTNVKLYRTGVALLLLWACALSLVARPALAIRDAETRNHDQLVEAGRRYIGSGNYKVYLDDWQFYYAARTLGWRIYKTYSRGQGTENEQLELLGDMDFAIVSASDLTASESELLTQAGLKKSTHVTLYQLNLSPQPAGSYRDFVIFSR